MMEMSGARNRWVRFWMRYAGRDRFGRLATRLAAWLAPPYYGRCPLAQMNVKGYISPKSVIHHDDVAMGPHVFIGDGVIIFQAEGGGPVKLDEQVHVYGDTYIQTGSGGFLHVGSHSHIHPRCQISAYKAGIRIGRHVQVAPNCAFYPYNHGIATGTPIRMQPLETKGDIVIADDAWLGYGVIVLDGVRIGQGAVVGAGSTVSADIPDGAVAVGSPARVVRMRGPASSSPVT